MRRSIAGHRDTLAYGQFEAAETKLIDENLSDHPADEEEAISREWLETECGFRREEHPQKMTLVRHDALSIGLWDVEDGWKAMLHWHPKGAMEMFRGLTTRSQVYQLMRLIKGEG